MITLFTIGYEGAALVDFIATLRLVGIKRVVDVRQLPQSRRPGFSKKTLSAALEASGISYEHRRQLGDPKAGRDAARAGRMEEFKHIFGRHMEDPKSLDELAEVAATARNEPCVLLCYERDHKDCHRSLLCDDLVKAGDFKIHHLGVQPVRAEKIFQNGTERHIGACG